MTQNYTVQQAAEILGYCTNTIYSFLRKGKLKGIRVGRGKFKIPQEEIERLFSSSKERKKQPETEAALPPESSSLPVDGPISWQIYSFFDWFVGVASVVFGASLFLFNQVYERTFLFLNPGWLWPLKISLIVIGMGLLFSDFVGKKHQFLRKFFYFLLFFVYFAVSFIWGLSGDFLGSAIWGLLAFVIALRFFARISSLKSFSLYLFLLGISLPVALLFSAPLILPENLSFLLNWPVLVFLISLLLVLAIFFILKWAHQKNKIIFGLTFCLSLIPFVFLSFWSAQKVSWDKAFFLLFLSFVGFFMGGRKVFESFFSRNRLAVFNTFIFITAFLLSLVGVNLVIQKNSLQETHKDLAEKIDYARFMIGQSLESAKNTLEKTAPNPLLISQLLALKNGEEANQELLLSLIKPLAGGNPNLKRIFILDEDKNIIVHYPHDLNLEKLSFVDGNDVKQAVNSHEFYISNIFESASGEPAVIISTPILDEQKNKLGTLAGFLDLDILNNRLQAIANQQKGEFFVLIDGEENYLAYPKRELIATSSLVNGENEVLFLKTNGREEKKNWQIVAKAPISAVLASANAFLWTIYFIATIGVVIAIFFFLLIYPKSVKKINDL